MFPKKRSILLGALAMAILAVTWAVAAGPGAAMGEPSLFFPFVRHDYTFWALAFDPSPEHQVWDVVGTSDGGLVAAGFRGPPYEGVWLEKVDALGRPVWSASSAGGRLTDSAATAVQPTDDGGFVLQGSGDPAWLSRVDRYGAALWQKSYVHPIFLTWFNGVQRVSDGSYLAVGTLSDSAGVYSLGLLAKINAAGAVEWAYSLAEPENRVYYSGMDAVETQPGRFAVLLHRAEYDPLALPESWLVELDEGGTTHWARSFGALVWDLARASDGNIVAAGSGDPDAGNYQGAWQVKIDSAGAILWQNYYLIDDFASGASVGATADGFLLAGHSFDAKASEQDSFLLRLDTTGGVLWTRKYGDVGLFDLATAVRQAPTGAILLATLVRPAETAQLPRARIYKLEPDGEVHACQAITEVTATAVRAHESSSPESIILAPLSLTAADFVDWTSGTISREPFCPATYGGS